MLGTFWGWVVRRRLDSRLALRAQGGCTLASGRLVFAGPPRRAKNEDIAAAQVTFNHHRTQSGENRGRCRFCADTPLFRRGSVANSAAPRERGPMAHVGPRSSGRRWCFWIFVWPQKRVGDISRLRWIFYIFWGPRRFLVEYDLGGGVLAGMPPCELGY